MKTPFLRTSISAIAIIASIATASFAFAASTQPQAPVVVRTHAAQRSNSSHLANHSSDHTTRKGLGGTVTAINATTITVTTGGENSTTATIDASKAMIQGTGKMTISDIHIGDKIVAIGTVTGSSVAAKFIIDRPIDPTVETKFRSFETEHLGKSKSVANHFASHTTK